jgi:hypothetical protein
MILIIENKKIHNILFLAPFLKSNPRLMYLYFFNAISNIKGALPLAAWFHSTHVFHANAELSDARPEGEKHAKC